MFFRRKAKPADAPPPPPVVAPPVIVNGEPDMRGLGLALWQKKNAIIGFTLIAAIGALVIVNSITPRYRSEARLLLEVRESVFMRAEADRNGGDRSTNLDPDAVASQIQVVLSRDLAREVIKKENLASNPEFGSGGGGLRSLLGLFGMGRNPSTLSEEERILEAFYDRLNVYAIEKSRVIVVDFASADPELAARVANSVAETYLSLQQSAKQGQTRAAGDWLAVEIDRMRTRVEEAEAKVEGYRVSANLFSGSNNTSLPTQQLTEINSQISAARGQKADLEARAQQIREQVRSGRPIESSDIANSDSMRRLVEQRIALRSQLAEQSTTLMDQHPRIKELRAQIAEIDRQVRTEGERLARQLDNDAKVAGNRVETLSASLDQVKKLASQTNEQDVQLRALEREAKTQRDLLESYLAKYREASARDNINAAPPEARIISRATPAINPSYPKKLPTVLIAAFAAFALSAGFTVTGALLAAPTPTPYAYGYGPAGVAAPSFAPPPPPQQPMFAAPLPRVPSPPLAPTFAQPVAPAFAPAMGLAAAAAVPLAVSTIDQIAQSLRQAGDAGRRVTVVGAMRNAGTTYAAITLARALAKEANVVLVDFAFGAPNLSVISTDPNAPGVAELVRGAASFGDIITRDQYSNVHLIATGNVGNDGPLLAASPMLATVIEALVQSYNHVVIDAGSAADVAVERFAPLAQRAVLVSADPANPSTRAARDRMMLAGFADVTLVAGAVQAAAA
ncbi:MAG: exopolysaccharide transport family protein [Pseudolabrys sp.]|nr:exopolysaccharide transport family protein [Pseudolabrys sp.]